MNARFVPRKFGYDKLTDEEKQTLRDRLKEEDEERRAVESALESSGDYDEAPSLI